MAFNWLWFTDENSWRNIALYFSRFILKKNIYISFFLFYNLGQYLLNNNDLLIKTAISRSIVCIIENEWVPNWTELFPKFQQIVNDPKLFCQSQMIFIILKRLVEDIVTLSTIENINKRRDLSTLLSANMREILTMSLIKIRFCIENEMNGKLYFFLLYF